MNSRARTRVAGLIHRRSIGEISREEFFELLAEVRSDSVPSVSRLSSVSARSEAVAITPGASVSDFDQLDEAGVRREAWGAPLRGDWQISDPAGAPPLLTTHEADSLVERSRSSRAAVPASSPTRTHGAWGPPSRSPYLPSEMHKAASRQSPVQRPLANQLSPTSVQMNVAERSSSGVPSRHPTVGSPVQAEPPLDSSERGTTAAVPEPAGPRVPAIENMAQCLPDDDCVEIGDDAVLRRSLALSTGPVAVADMEPKNVKHSVSRSKPAVHTTFAQRNEIWHLRRMQRWSDMQKQTEEKELKECSFHPKTRKQPTQDSSIDVKSLSHRLAAPARSQLRASHLAAQWREQRDKEIMQECTFAPDLSKSCSSFRLRTPDDAGSEADSLAEASVGACASARRAALSDGADGDADLSFKPRTNSIAPHMINAHAYLQEGVFERLSRQPCSEPNGGAHEDVSISSAVAGRDLSRASVDQLSTISKYSANGSFHETFVGFLQRQNEHEQERLNRLEQLETQVAPSLQPEICERSRILAERHRGKGNQSAQSPYERLSYTKEAPEPQDVTTGMSEAAIMELRRSMKPQINKRSSMLRARSCTELSTNDQQRREERADMRREMAKKEEEKANTFKPTLNKNDLGVKSRVNVLEEPETYLERVEKKRVREAARCERVREEREREELRECSWKPKTTQAPAFIHKMAQSYKTLRSLKEKENQKQTGTERPDWR